MASNPLTFTLTPGMAPAAPLMRLLASFDRQKVEAFAEISVALLDMYDAPADPDEPSFETQQSDGRPGDPEDHESGGDEEEAAWIEWHTQHAGTRSQCQIAGHEDDEEDDPREDGGDTEPNGDEADYSMAEDEPVSASAVLDRGAGCPIGDPGEHWQQTHNVPMEPVHTAEHNIFNDKRTPLGLSNLQSSFRTNGSGVRSADSGNTLVTKAHTPLEPGTPV
jgi:hypothetical protein